MKNLINRLLADNRGRGLFRIENAAADEATIYLYDAIVSDDFFGGVSAINFVQALAGTSAKTIHLRINCPGGDVFAGQAMAAALRQKPAKCVAHIDGLAASAASWVALACDETVISEGGMVMIHQAQCMAAGSADDLRETADLLDKVDVILVAGYVKDTGQTAEQITAWMADETWFSADEAVANGFADRIDGSSPKNLAAWNLSGYANAPVISHLEEHPAPVDESSRARADRLLNHYGRT